MKELKAEVEREIVKRLVRALGPVKIYLFGSHAYGKPDRDSDVDLLVVVRDTETPYRDLTLRGRLSLSGMCIPVDLLVFNTAEMQKWSNVPCNIIHTVVQKGRLVYESFA
jgi:predicted nucleotidyltransferase